METSRKEITKDALYCRFMYKKIASTASSSVLKATDLPRTYWEFAEHVFNNCQNLCANVFTVHFEKNGLH